VAANRFELLGMAPSGEACLVVDGEGRTWVSSIYTHNREIPDGDVDRIIAQQDWIRVNETFASWDDLVDYRATHAESPPPPLELAYYTSQDVRDALEETETADTDEERADARSLLLEVLRCCSVVFGDDDLRTMVVDRLGELTGPALVPVPAPSGEFAEAMSRLPVFADA
jgi:hypothetical protein